MVQKPLVVTIYRIDRTVPREASTPITFTCSECPDKVMGDNLEIHAKNKHRSEVMRVETR